MWLRAIVFYILAFVFTIVLGGIQQGAALPQDALILPQWGPGLAALLMLFIFRKDGSRLPIITRSTPVRCYGLAVLVPAGGALVAYLINSLILGAPRFGDLTGIPWPLVLWMPLGALGEELGWRGYLHPRLNAGIPGLGSSVIVGALWGLWHVGSYANGALYMAFFVILMISYSIVIYNLVAAAGFNVVAAALFHLTINITSLFSISRISSLEFVIVNAGVWAVIAAAFVAGGRRPLGARTAT
jgi:membrane protease YdiL (CAAX protease family)